VSELIEQLGLTKRVIITGFIPDEHLLSLYKHCEVLAMPSIYEGFGLPALEALSMNKKVVISRLNALADIVGDNIFITDVDQQSIAEALNKAIVSEPENFADIGNDWVSVAQKTLQMLVCNR
jgi:glycosyltransferase involved in cell wall biosynthesis